MQILDYDFPVGHTTSLCRSADDPTSKLCDGTKDHKHGTVVKRIGSSMDCKWSGPVSPQEFLDKFLDVVVAKTMPKLTHNRQMALKAAVTGSSDPSEGHQVGHHERFSYGPLIEALKEYCPKLKLEKTADTPEIILWSKRSIKIKPDITAYDSTQSPNARKTDLSLAEILFEIKSRNGVDPFAKIDAGLPNNVEADDTLDQISTYAGALLARQFRTHCFSVFIFGEHVRLVRWDRGGATFTDKFHLWEEPFLLDFLWRYNSADRETCGNDPSVVALNEKDAVGKRRASRARVILKMEKKEKVYEFTVDDEATKEKRVFYGGKVVMKTPPTPTGRSTRGFLVTTLDALDLIGSVADWSCHIHYLKETWRILLDALEPEWKIYQRLKGVNVPHVPTILASGDAVGKWQSTVTGTVATKNYGRDIRRHYHCYVVMKEVGRPLTDFKIQKELVGAMRDALKAHQAAYEGANVLHRDVSVGNILIYGQGGLLIDWEFSKVVQPRISDTPRLDERTGTWQFISARILLLTGQDMLHTVADDLESFFHVLCWVAIQYVEHDLSDRKIIDFVRSVYDHSTQENGRDTGGKNKQDAILLKNFSESVKFRGGPLSQMIEAIEHILCCWYQSLNARANPLNLTPDEVVLYLKGQGIPESVFSKFRVTGRAFTELDRHAVQNILEPGDSGYFREILRIVNNLKQKAQSRYVNEVPELRSHDWMLQTFNDALDSLNQRPEDVQRVVHRNLWGAVKAARSREAREEKKRTWFEEYEKNKASNPANNTNEEVEEDAEAPPKKKPRTLASRSTSRARQGRNPQAGPSSIRQQSGDAAGGHQDEHPRKRSMSGGRHQQFHPSSNQSANRLRRSTRQREQSQNGRLSRRRSRG
ncbi:hypothetical protein E1B28_013776 [Marasmius oreades]|uniref:Fungal-type protein kinase domain-containing protein n=1 Tax=Marasmius oreades TaxID=181124 RepID=A0A9P7RRP5_9AGAR|nr:uncharacterized protein E1B28_013776 [Marasmius oreades]KAG7087838.1 hypothetical protein E1B28_013776 [Marasmius oreades]